MLKARGQIRKKELKQDALLEILYKVETVIKNNSQRMIFLTITIIVVLVVIVMMIRSKSEAGINATTAVGIAQIKLLSGDFEDAIVRLEEVLRKYPGTDASSEGKFYLANAYFSIGDKESSEQYYRKYIDESSKDKLLTSSAYAGIAVCLEDKGDYESAAITYVEASKHAQARFQIESFLMNAIRNYDKVGNYEEAIKIINEVLTDEETSFETMRKAEAWQILVEAHSVQNMDGKQITR